MGGAITNFYRVRWPRPSFLAWLAVLTPLILFSLLPLTRMLFIALSAASVSEMLNNARLWQLLGRTVALCLSVATCSTVLGAPVGYLFGALAWPGKTFARIVLILPLAIPPYAHAIGWTTLLRPRGFTASTLSILFGTIPSEISDKFYSFAGATFVLALCFFPIAMLFCERALALSSPSLNEAAQVFGANKRQVFAFAIWPTIQPAILSSAMIIFLLTASDLGVPTILKVPVFNFEVFTQLGAFNDTAMATLLTLPLLCVGIVVLTVERRLTRESAFETNPTDIGFAKQATRTRTGINWITLAGLAFISLGLPLGSIIAQGMDPQALRQMFQLAQGPAINTFRYAISASLLITLMGFTLGWLARTASPWRLRVTNWLLISGFAVPGTIVALALLSLYDEPNISAWITPTILVVAALVVRYLIVAHRIATGAIAQIPSAFLENAAIDGATPIQTIRYVLLPLIRVALFASFAIVFVLSVGEIGSTILLYPPGGESLPIALYSIEANSPRSYVAALTLIQLLVSLTPLAIVAFAISVARKAT